ncbi:hypothetical protein C5G87_21575 [Paenibacillus peoriae]|uniref:hypothetical protein n=1 Tax=Paenibacillus peoriae TaxID=59893 RepID=UPI000CEC2567|nr:hypothetical protein [Paenibacillus peoriae]PPQ46212.1 hypothetical protein C5G87_21575 [Paenibacillus peoriae]
MKTSMENFQKYNTQLLSIEYAAITDIQSLLKFIPSFKENHPKIKLDGYQPNILYIITENLIGFFPENYDLADLKEEVRLIPATNTKFVLAIAHKFFVLYFVIFFT